MVFGEPKPPRPHYNTPPYVTASPEVVSVPLNPPHGRGFLVLASDGLYDILTNSEIVGLVGGWLDGLEGSHTREQVVALTKMADHLPDTYMPTRDYIMRTAAKFTFRDANLATHLIRNAIAGDDNEQLRLQYSFAGSSARNERDDVRWFRKKPS